MNNPSPTDSSLLPGESIAQPTGQGPQISILRPLATRNFRLLWMGESVSVLGDQFHFVALSWLTLQLTGSGLALGTVLMVGAIPRLLFMLIGGAVTDRMSPRLLMIASNASRAILVAVIAALVALNAVQLWQLYILSAVFGLADAFFYPAINAITPALVEKEELGASTALMQGTSQLAMLIGPAPAGIIIKLVGTASAFGFNALSFIFATLTMLLIRDFHPLHDASKTEPSEKRSLFADIKDGMRYAWGNPVIRALLIIMAAVDFSFIGPFNVGLASLADHRFTGGSEALGIMLSAWGAGALVGVLVAGSIKNLRRRGLLVLGVVTILGVGLTVIGVIPTLVLASVVIGLMGFGSGFINVIMVSWLQANVDSQMIGRVMSLVMFASAGLSPISYAIAGALVDVHAALLFASAGAIVLASAVYAAVSPALRRLD